VEDEEQILESLIRLVGPHAGRAALVRHLRLCRGRLYWAGALAYNKNNNNMNNNNMKKNNVKTRAIVITIVIMTILLHHCSPGSRCVLTEHRAKEYFSRARGSFT
jgi:hypothetical protein